MLKFSGLAIALVGLCGCATSSGLDRSSSAVTVAQSLPPPDSPTFAIEVAPYRIAPGDEIAVSVFGTTDLDKSGTVDAGGNFAMPLAGSIAAAGRTPEEVAKLVEGQLRGPYMKNPKVSVNIKKSVNQQTVTIDGAVQQPGIYPVVGRMTLQKAIAIARGASETANIRSVVVFRTVSNQKMAAIFNLKDIRTGRYADPQIFGNDVVIVGESAIEKAFRNVRLAFPIFGRFVPYIIQ